MNHRLVNLLAVVSLGLSSASERLIPPPLNRLNCQNPRF